jgi:restriction system protein
MPIPDFQSLMLPYLRLLRDNQEHNIPEITEKLASEFNLTPEEKSQRSPNSSNIIFNNKAGWTKTHLKNAKLLENPRRGVVKITERGLTVLNENPPKIDMRYLSRFPEYQTFRAGSREETQEETAINDSTVPGTKLTPFELLDQSYKELRYNLANELLEQVQTSTPHFFEKMVIDLLLAMGYGGSREDAGEAIGQSHDEGIDGIIKEDKLGLDVIYIQAKKWNNTNVGRKEIQSFVGSLEGRRARKGIFITTSKFTPEALTYVQGIEKKVVLIDGKILAQLMIDHGIGVTDINSYTIKRIDSDYFIED